MATYKADTPRYGPFVRLDEPPSPADAETESLLRKLGEWLGRRDPRVLGLRLVLEDDEAGGRPMVHIAFPLGYRRSRDPGAPVDPRNPTIADVLGPELAAAKRLNIQPTAQFDRPFSYIRIAPEALYDQIEVHRRRLADELRRLDAEVKPLVSAVVAASQGDVDHATIAAPADWMAAIPQRTPSPPAHDTPRSSEIGRVEADPALLVKGYLSTKGLKPDAVAAIRITTLLRKDELWLRIDVPRGGNLRGAVPALLVEAGVRPQKNAKATTDDEILGTIYCRAQEAADLLGVDPTSMREYRPKRPGPH